MTRTHGQCPTCKHYGSDCHCAEATYQLKPGEEVRDGKLYGWTGKKCTGCKGTGDCGDESPRGCPECGGTGDEWDEMPLQSADLLPSDEHQDEIASFGAVSFLADGNEG
jgi:hypothetical protein